MIPHPELRPLSGLSWHRVDLRLKNTRNTYAREHPLSIFNAVFLSAAAGCRFDRRQFFFHPRRSRLDSRIHKDAVYELELIFPRAPRERIDAFLEALRSYLDDPAHNFRLLHLSAPVTRNLESLEAEFSPAGGWEDEICLDFLTPFPFRPADNKRKWMIEKDYFFRQLANRIKRFYGLELAGDAWRDIRLLPYYWQYAKNIRHKSKSNEGEQFVNGTVGPLYLRGPVPAVLPLLLVCAELHGGRRLANGQGYYRLLADRPYFDPQLLDFDLFQTMAAGFGRQSDLGEEMARSFLDQPAALADLHGKVAAGEYEPRPAAGFHVDKRRGGQRLLATLELKDHLVHKFLAALLTPVMDRMFEEASVGFRVGRSRETAREMIRRACGEGFCYVLESDVAAFFDRIDWEILEQKIDDCLPRGDRLTRRLLGLAVRLPLVVEGRLLARTTGLVPGSPLSPLLANLYLDSFDEEMERRGFRLVRYADDFLVLTRSREEAEHALGEIRKILASLKLLLREDKTSTQPLDAGFSFLGIDFAAGMDEAYIADAALGKTLYLRHQYAFIGLDGDSLIVRKDRRLQARLPVKRIAEIVVLGSNTVSSRLLGRCAREKIPVSFCSPMGYYYSTLRPDSKRHLQVAAAHSSAFYVLDEEERVRIAARILAAKLHNYLAWFRERWPSESRAVVHHLETCLASVAKTDSINKIRGYEGDAARQVFAFVNRRCKNELFHCPGRKKRARLDRYNSLLDFAYSLLFTRLNVLLRGRGLNPYLGILHSHKDNYESLVCDLQEPFRCRMDRFVVKTVNREIVKPDDFEKNDSGRLTLLSPAVGKFIQAFEREMDVRLAGDHGTLKQLLSAQVRSVFDWVGNQGELRFFQTGTGSSDSWMAR